MSIIIRLQNLPWSANAENIRQFFSNLVIPDGGVHIVGGEHGDAFIAFGSDEDARQAMTKDGGDIKGVKVRLLLSSRVEMQKVIDTARQQALTSQNLLQTLSTVNQHLQYDPSAAAMPVGLPPNLLSALPGLVNLPGLNSLPMMPNLPTMPMPGMPGGLPQMPFPMPATTAATPAAATAKPTPAPAVPTPPKTGVNAEPADKKKESAQQSASRTQKSKSRSRSRSSSRSRDRRSYRDKYRSRDGRSGDRKYRRDRSKSRDRDKKSDRYRRRSRSRERRNDDRGRDYRNRSKERRRDSDRNGAKKDGNSAEAAAKVPFKAGGFNTLPNIALPSVKMAGAEMKIPGLGDKATTDGGTPPMASAAKSSPSADVPKSSDPKAAWSSMIAPTVPAWTTAIPTPPERKSVDSPKAAGSPGAPAAAAGAAPQMPSMPGVPPMPAMPNMSAMGATMSMASMSSMPYNMAATYSMAYAGAPNMYGMNRFPLTAQQAAAMYPGYSMGMMAQPNYGQYPASAAAAAAAKPAAQQPEHVERASMDPHEEDEGDEEEDEEVDCFGRVRKKSRRPSYSPEKVDGNYENGDRYDRRDSYRSRNDNSYNKSYHRDSYNHDDNRFHRGGPDDGSFRKPYRRSFDRHDGGGDERPRGGFDRRGDSAGGDRRGFQSRFDGGSDERDAAPYDGRNEQPAGRHSKFDEPPFERGGDHRRNVGRFESRDNNEDRTDRSFKQSRFDDTPRYNSNEDLDNESAASAQSPQIFQTCVEVRNIPPGVTEQDIKRFFEPLPLYDSCIKFQFKTHPDNSQSTSVLVKFVNTSQRTQALQLSGKFLKGQRTLILACDQQTFEKSEDMAAQLRQPYLKLAFVPKRATPDDIANAFISPPDEVVIVQQNGRESLEAYLKFSDTQPAVDALKHKDKVRICGSRVKLSAIPEAEFDTAKKTAQASGTPPTLETPSGNYVVKSAVDESQLGNNALGSAQLPGDVNPQNVEGHCASDNGPKMDNPPASNNLGNTPPLTCIRFNSLPLNVVDRDIVNFLKDVEVHPHRIHMMYTPEGTMSGEAFCEFLDEGAVHAAMQKDRCLLNNHIIEMTPISLDELMAAVNDVPAYNDLPPFDGNAEQFDEPLDGSQMYPGFGGRGSRPYMGRGGPRRPFGGLRGQYGEIRGGRRPPAPPGPAGPLGPPIQAGPDQFGRPRCVVSLENVPYKANVEDIMEFFREFNVTRSDVIRRYNEHNLATGDARVCLCSPTEAMRAAQTLDGQKIFDRYISVRYIR